MKQLNLLSLHNSPRSFSYKEDFIFTESNITAYRALFSTYKKASCIILYGPKGSGKTHLAHIWCIKKKALLLDQVDAKKLINFSCVLENINTITEEIALLNSYNNAIENNTSLLLTTQIPISGLSFKLQDLSSRLLAAPLINLKAPDDKLLKIIIAKEFYYRNIRIKAEAINYIINNIERSYSTIIKVVDYIDKIALNNKKNISVQFLSNILQNFHFN